MRNRRRTTAARGRAFALALTLSLSAVVPIAADARGHHRRHQHHRAAHAQHVIRWGSSLASTATQTIPGTYAQDAEFWLTQLGSQPLAGVEPVVTAPVSGVIKRVLLKVGDDSNAVPIRFSVVKALGDGRTEVLTTSTPHLILPAHTPGIHTFDFSQLQFKMPINKGDYLTIDTPGVRPEAMFWYAAVAGCTTALYTSRGPTQDPGYARTMDVRPGLELLMQVVEQPGPSYHFHIPR